MNTDLFFSSSCSLFNGGITKNNKKNYGRIEKNSFNVKYNEAMSDDDEVGIRFILNFAKKKNNNKKFIQPHVVQDQPYDESEDVIDGEDVPSIYTSQPSARRAPGLYFDIGNDFEIRN